jgi:hypothetical protein
MPDLAVIRIKASISSILKEIAVYALFLGFNRLSGIAGLHNLDSWASHKEVADSLRLFFGPPSLFTMG